MQKYFRNQCTLDEIEQVLDWFQTKAGQVYLEERLDRDMERYSDDENLLLHPDVPSEEVLQNIERTRRKIIYRKRSQYHWWLRVAAVLIICVIFAGGGYWVLQDGLNSEDQEQEIVFRTISTTENQQRLVTLGDGTQVRLNTNSSIVVPEQFPIAARKVQLTGEAYFKVARDEDRPFSIQVDQAVIRVLGTEFNVKVDQSIRQVQVAVAEGKVSLGEENNGNGREVILTENTFALLHLDDGEILLERSAVDNYLSWISGNLLFHDEPLWIVSRYLERIYGVSILFEDENLRDLSLSTDIMKQNLGPVLDIISETLGISYRYENDTVLWSEDK